MLITVSPNIPIQTVVTQHLQMLQGESHVSLNERQQKM